MTAQELDEKRAELKLMKDARLRILSGKMRSSVGSGGENVAYMQVNLKDLNELIRELQDEIRIAEGGVALAIHFR